MPLNPKCPKCGSTRVQLSHVESHPGCLWFLLLGWIYLLWVWMKWCVGILIFFYLDWWLAILQKVRGKGYIWKSKRWFCGRTKLYYCHDCSHNFRG